MEGRIPRPGSGCPWWMTVNEQRWLAPLYWVKRDGAWWNYTLSVFALWTKRTGYTHRYFEMTRMPFSGALPTEFEWERAALIVRSKETSSRTAIHPQPSTALGQDRHLHQMFGDVWEWTRSVLAPVSRRPRRIAHGKFTTVLLSCAYTHSPHYRNFFSRETLQFTGIDSRAILHEPPAGRPAVLDVGRQNRTFSLEAIAGLPARRLRCRAVFL